MKYTIFLIFIVFLVIPSSAHALSSEWQQDDAVAVRLISGVNGVGQETTIPLAVDVKLSSDWHTYWRSPGEAGLPPQLDWQKSLNDDANLKSARLLYPAPHRYSAFGLETIGYRDHVVFPVLAELRLPGHDLHSDVTIQLLVCSSVCVPKTFNFSLLVPTGPATESAEAPLLKQFRDQVPADGDKSGLLIASLTNEGQDLSVHVTSRELIQSPDLFIESKTDTPFAAPQIEISPDQHSATFVTKSIDAPLVPGSSLTVTITNNENALETTITVPPITAPALIPPASSLSLFMAIFFAIIGGFILNLMPCVLPVLSLKFMSIISHGGGDRKAVRRSFLMTACGIFFSYFVLAVMTVTLKALGLTFGWGVQFQQPLFIICLIVLLTYFSCSMWGFLEIPLPRFLADTLTGSYHPKRASDFAAGAFATLLATPCSAPFLGTAIGFALAANPFDIFIIFSALGLGMSIPYLFVAIYPRLATALPKPGPWMLTLKHVLGWALAFTALWLLWVLAAQITSLFAFLVGLCMLATLLLLASRKVSFMHPKIAYAAGIFSLLAFVFVVIGSDLPKASALPDQDWVPFDEKAIAVDLAEGKTVFVNVTADWCLTCKANVKFILSQQTITQRLFHSQVIAMQADWTNPDPVITTFLQKYQRYGIPFNIVFGPEAKQGLVLPELLSTDAVLQALNQASLKSP